MSNLYNGSTRFTTFVDRALTHREIVQNYNLFKDLWYLEERVRSTCEILLEEIDRDKKIKKLLDEKNT